MTSKNLFFALFLAGCGGAHSSTTNEMPPDSPADSPTVKGVGDRTAGDPSSTSPTTPGDPTMPSDPAAPDPSVDGGADGGTIVSFARDVRPIFEKRICYQCHSGSGPGKDLGNLTLDGSTNLIYKEVAVEISPNFKTTRVDLKDPEKSLILTMPGPEVDAHPVVVFTTTADPDYQTILEWIRQGAKFN